MTVPLDFRRFAPHLFPQRPVRPSEKYFRHLAKIDPTVPILSWGPDETTRVRNAVLEVTRKEIARELQELKQQLLRDPNIIKEVLEREMMHLESTILARVLPEVMQKLLATKCRPS